MPSLSEQNFSNATDNKLLVEGVASIPLRCGSEKNTGAKVMSLLVAVLFNGAVLLVLMLISFTFFEEDEIELVVAQGPRDASTNINKEQFQQSRQMKPAPATSSSSSPILTSVAASPNAVFAIESLADTNNFGIGDGWGKGASFGSGNQGGSIGFFGSRSVAQRVVFIVDVSGSLSNQQFTMIKNELNKSLKRLAPSVNFQVIFFSGPAWFAGDEQSVKNKVHTIIHKGKKYVWKTNGGPSRYYIESEEDLYTSPWVIATQANIKKTGRRIEAVKKSFGTDWRHPLKMALQMKPAADVVYFLTDGVVGNGQQAVNEVIKLNKRGPKAKIYTISMMQPRAENLLKDLAERSGGEFSIVMGDGEVKKKKKTKK